MQHVATSDQGGMFRVVKCGPVAVATGVSTGARVMVRQTGKRQDRTGRVRRMFTACEWDATGNPVESGQTFRGVCPAAAFKNGPAHF